MFFHFERFRGHINDYENIFKNFMHVLSQTIFTLIRVTNLKLIKYSNNSWKFRTTTLANLIKNRKTKICHLVDK